MKLLQQILMQLIHTFLEALLMPTHRNKTFKSTKVQEAVTNWKLLGHLSDMRKSYWSPDASGKLFNIYTTLQYFLSFLDTILYFANYIFCGTKQSPSAGFIIKGVFRYHLSVPALKDKNTAEHVQNQYLLEAKWPCKN